MPNLIHLLPYYSMCQVVINICSCGTMQCRLAVMLCFVDANPNWLVSFGIHQEIIDCNILLRARWSVTCVLACCRAQVSMVQSGIVVGFYTPLFLHMSIFHQLKEKGTYGQHRSNIFVYPLCEFIVATHGLKVNTLLKSSI